MAGGAMILAALSFLGASVLFVIQRNQGESQRELGEDNCLRIHKVVSTLGGMIDSGQEDIIRLGTEGTLSATQVKRLLRKNGEQSETLRKADCPSPPMPKREKRP